MIQGPTTRSGRVPPVVGRLCLDFAHTGGRGEYAVLEALREPDDLGRWLAISPLAVHGVTAGPVDLETARDLRDVVYRSARSVVHDQPPAPPDVAALNAAAAEPPLVPRVDPTTTGASWSQPTVTAALSDIARDALRLLADPAQRARVRECAAPDCAVLFYDDSRPGRRRWCEAARCGDRNRARAHRARKAPP